MLSSQNTNDSRMNEITKTEPVILAGGLGSRLSHLLPNVPKPMAIVRGRPFIEWLIEWLRRSGFRRAAVSAGYRGDIIEQHFLEYPVPGFDVTCVHEKAPLGTGGGFLHAAQVLPWKPEIWVVLNGDSLILADLPQAMERFKQSTAMAGLLARRVTDAGRFGVLSIDENDFVRSFDEKPTNAMRDAWINAGVYLFRSGVLDEFPQVSPLSFEYDVFPTLLSKGVRIVALRAEGPFLDIGTEETLLRADDFLQQHVGLIT